MARFRPGPLATDISGTIGSTVFARGRTGPILRRQQPHRANQSNRQRLAQSNFGMASNAWHDLGPALKLAWNKAATTIATTNADPSVRMTGFALFMKMYATYAGATTISDTVQPTAIASSPILLIYVDAEYDTPELAPVIYGPGVSSDALVYFRAATNFTDYQPTFWKNWKWIGYGEYSSYPIDFISGWLQAFGTPQNGQWLALQAITIEPGQAPSSSYIAPARWHPA